MRKLKSVRSEVKFRIGAVIDLMAYTAFWLSLVNFVLIALTAYNTTIRVFITDTLPWFNIGWYALILFLIVVVIMLVEYFVVFPARQSFRNQWEYRQDSPIRKDLEEIKKQLKELKDNK